MFPSPIGELHFSMKLSTHLWTQKKVSVPYRGATFLNSLLWVLCSNCSLVSVPYRGATFLNPTYGTLTLFRAPCFRPLSGSYISQSLEMPANCHEDVKGFRPLSGSYISQLYYEESKRNHKKFPSPIGELHFSIYKWRDYRELFQSFRPLSGSYISQ